MTFSSWFERWSRALIMEFALQVRSIFLTIALISVSAVQGNEPLLNTGQINPDLLQYIVQNPLLASQLQAQVGLFPLVGTPNAGDLLSTTLDPCAALRAENANLKQIIGLLTILEQQSGVASTNAVERNLRQLPQNQVEQFLKQAASPSLSASFSFESVFVTPTPTWSTTYDTSTITTVKMETSTQEIPIIYRGTKIITTIEESFAKTVTETEVKAVSSEITPTPTWSTQTVLLSTTQADYNSLLAQVIPTKALDLAKDPLTPQIPSVWPKMDTNHRPFDPKTGREQADVLEIDADTSPVEAKSHLDKLKQAYGVFFASSAQRNAEKYRKIFGNRSAPERENQRNPIFDERNGDDNLERIYDQEAQPARNQYIYSRYLPKAQSVSRIKKEDRDEANLNTLWSRVQTQYISGSVPGEYTTRLTTIVDGAAQSRSNRRWKRHNHDMIRPSPVEPITKTTLAFTDRSLDRPNVAPFDEIEFESHDQMAKGNSMDLQSSFYVTFPPMVTSHREMDTDIPNLIRLSA
ncbi:uncharacterized protein LOC131890624 [Tigriopus californicus]|uniref:uncharacterized protein LOC131890624 n=1 Tax=Tigriopus californicus TaxID=6832 RepID=UPI0027D9D197|nr:uncharacterized protein LOC131890624 [Tigriopus californicus]